MTSRPKVRKGRVRMWCDALVLAVAATTIAGCSSDCIALGTYGFVVTVVDSISNQPPNGQAEVSISAGDYSESLIRQPFANTPVYTGGNREGVFTLRVTADGYQPYVQGSLRVRSEGQCGAFNTNRITVRLVRSAP